MAEEPISDKALIRSYLKDKGISRGAFGLKLGFSRSFLDSDGTITVDNLRKIIEHEEFNDFNTEAFLQRKEEQMAKQDGLLSEELVNQSFLVEAVQKLTTLEVSDDEISQEDARKLLTYLKKSIKKLSSLSEDYQVLYKEYEQLYRSVITETKK